MWPDNRDAVNVFISLATQWRVGFSGATGLDYLALYAKLDRMHLSDERALQIEDDIRVLEDAALATMRENSATKK